MPRTLWLTLLLLVALAGVASSQTSAFSLGLSSYGVLLDNESPFEDDNFFGAALIGTYAFSDRLAARGVLYSTTHEDDSDLENMGLEAHVLYGSHMMREGFRYYGIGGFYSETWDNGLVDYDFSGVTLGFGIGYVWEKVAIDWWGAWRTRSDYEDLARDFGADMDIEVASGALAISYRF